ncbi:uncharacterized protein (DUF58 family) [Clostridium pascui]|uniref:DUF58 domain-containing protein n=1 Tax=Clostridium pascui TaxID=46609 RepID=UPI001957DC53|nr:DUF58 domain-containing protein [Clostridium pascui]MBM7870502.1 uncharacterized protein (DUF58 family) [Clostridium pascui]
MIKIKRFFIILLLGTLTYAYLDGSIFAYSLFHSAFLSLIIAFIYLIYIRKKVAVEIRFNNDKLYTKEPCEFTVIIKNYSILPIPYLQIFNKTLCDFGRNFKNDVVILSGDKNKRIKEKLCFNIRGIYNLGVTEIIIKDFLYIFTTTFILKSNQCISVYPKVHSFNSKIVHGYNEISIINSNRKNVDGESSVRDIRKYRVGDSLKNIHWKLSAKYGELYIKNFDYSSGEKYSILLNMNKLNIIEEDVVEEKTVELCISLVSYLQDKCIKTKVYIKNQENRSFYIEKRGDVSELMEYFLLHKSNGEGKFQSFVYDSLNSVGKSTLIIITGVLTEEQVNIITSLKRMGYNLEVVYVNIDFKDLRLLEQLKKNDINALSYRELIKEEE